MNRTKILAALAPLIAVVSGGVATWLLVHLHALNVFATQGQVARLIASAMTFGVTTLLVYLSTHVHWKPMLMQMGAAQPVHIPPLKVILTLLAPYVSVAAGWIAAWLAVKVHVLEIFHVDQAGLTQTIGAAIVFGITALVTWLAHHDIVTETA